MYTILKKDFFMANIILRKFKEKDEKNLGRCIANKMIPFCLVLKCDCKTMLNDYIQRDMNLEPALAIVDEKTDVMLGALEALLIDDVLLTSYYVLPSYDVNSHIAKTALGLFVEFIRKNNTDVKRIQVCINMADSDTRRVVIANGFVKNREDEFSEEWEKLL